MSDGLHGADSDVGESARRGPHWALVGLVVIAGGTALVLGTHGYMQDDEARGFGHALYQTVQLFLLNAPAFKDDLRTELEIARWLAALAGIAGVAGIVTGARRLLLDRSRGRSLDGLSNHVVICGLGRKGMELVRQLAGGPVVVLDKSPPPDLLAECTRLGAHVLAADATDLGVLRRAGVARAGRVFVLCPADATNCEIAVQVAQLAERRNPKLQCFVHLDAVELGQTLQQMLPVGGDFERMHLQPVDSFDPEAVSLLAEGLPLDHDGLAPGDPRGVRLVILGLGRMGRTLAVRAAQLGHFANGRRVEIEVIDRHASRSRDALLFHHPQIEQVAAMRYHQMEALSAEARELVETCCRDESHLTSVVIAFDDEPLALEIGLRLRPLFEPPHVRGAVRLEHHGGLVQLIERPAATGAAAPGLIAFGSSRHYGRLADVDAWPLEKFARQLHEAYVRLSLAAKQGAELEQARLRPSAQEWSRLPYDLRDSNRQAAAHMGIKLRALGLEAVAIDDPREAIDSFDRAQSDCLAELEHRRWLAERRVADWKWAEREDPARRLNPNVKEWAELTDAVRAYDYNSVAMIPKVLDSAGLKIVRRRAPPA